MKDEVRDPGESGICGPYIVNQTFLRGVCGIKLEIPKMSMVKVWIFCGTTQSPMQLGQLRVFLGQLSYLVHNYYRLYTCTSLFEHLLVLPSSAIMVASIYVDELV